MVVYFDDYSPGKLRGMLKSIYNQLMSDQPYSREALDDLIMRARDMRHHPTEAEAILWDKLRRRQLVNQKFRRQHIVLPFIVDFYCAAKKLIIEVDGSAHDHHKGYDMNREVFLRQKGYVVLRFSNQDVIDHLEDVLERIKEFVD